MCLSSGSKRAWAKGCKRIAPTTSNLRNVPQLRAEAGLGHIIWEAVVRIDVTQLGVLHPKTHRGRGRRTDCQQPASSKAFNDIHWRSHGGRVNLRARDDPELHVMEQTKAVNMF